MTLGDFIALGEFNLHQISQRTGIAYSTLHKHLNGGPIKVDTAKKLEAFDPRMRAADLLGLTAKPARKKVA